MGTVTEHLFFSTFQLHTPKQSQSQEFTAYLERSYSRIFDFVMQSNHLKHTAL